MSLYVLSRGPLEAKCLMEYDLETGRPVSCTIRGARIDCIRSAVNLTSYADKIALSEPGDAEVVLHIYPSILQIGRTPGEVIRDILTVALTCVSP